MATEDIKLKAGDYVVYPTHGVGLVKAVEALVGAGQVSVQAPTLPERPTWVKRERS